MCCSLCSSQGLRHRPWRLSCLLFSSRWLDRLSSSAIHKAPIYKRCPPTTTIWMIGYRWSCRYTGGCTVWTVRSLLSSRNKLKRSLFTEASLIATSASRKPCGLFWTSWRRAATPNSASKWQRPKKTCMSRFSGRWTLRLTRSCRRLKISWILAAWKMTCAHLGTDRETVVTLPTVLITTQSMANWQRTQCVEAARLWNGTRKWTSLVSRWTQTCPGSTKQA